MKKYLLLSIGILLALAITLPAAAASQALDVTIEAEMSFPAFPATGSFIAYGPAVDAGLICNEGTVEQLSHRSLVGTPQGTSFQVVHQFRCESLGTFDVWLQVRIDDRGDNFHWRIIDGTGVYENLQGAGQGVGYYLGPFLVNDVYDGKLQ